MAVPAALTRWARAVPQTPLAPVEALLFSALSGVLMGAALPPRNLEPLGWIAFAPVMIAAIGRPAYRAAGLGLLAGMMAGLFCVGTGPTTESLRYAWTPFVWLGLMCAVSAGAGSWWRTRISGIPWVFRMACLGVTLEWMTTLSPLAVNLAICQFRSPFLSLAAVTGVWGVSFLLWLVNAAVADALLSRRVTAAAAVGAVALTALLISVGLRQDLVSACLARRPLQVAAIQDYTPFDTAAILPLPASTDVPDREALTGSAALQGARLAVWSEEGLGYGFIPGARANMTTRLARKLRIHLVVGYVQPSGSHPSDAPYNAAAIVNPRGEVRGIYHKIHLFLGEGAERTAGRQTPAFRTDVGVIGMQICFDTCYPAITRREVARGAQIIAVPNLDPVTPGGLLHSLHGALVVYRAVENQVAIVRADATGLSQVIDSDGREVAVGPLYAPAAVMGTVHLGSGEGTFYTRFGDWLVWGCLVGLLAIPLAARRWMHGDADDALIAGVPSGQPAGP